MHHTLVVEDESRAGAAIAHLVEKEGFEVHLATSLESARELLAKRSFACALLDLELPDGSGIDLVDELREACDPEIMILTGHASVDSAVEALRLGVVDFMTKPVDANRLVKNLKDIKKTLGLRGDVNKLREQLQGQGRFEGMVGASPPIREVYELIRKVAETTSTVLILGETGTGKELIAEAVHRLSHRSAEPFVAINCGAIQESLIESELFGHEAGAFTGASKKRKGVFEQAKGGTLFLDEVFEMPLEMQVKLLRVLEAREFRRVGGEKVVKADVRVIAATNRETEEVRADESVREDLLYRLMVFPIHTPPLRRRAEDIPLLAQHFLDLLVSLHGKTKRLSAEALEKLRAYEWPGNVRELRNVVERAYILGDELIDADSVVLDQPAARLELGSEITVAVGTTIADAERHLILATMKELDGEKPRVAETLGISLKTLYNRLKLYGESKPTG